MKYHDIHAAFRGEQTGPLAPSLVVNVQPEEFADEWKRKPRSAITVGLRLPPAEEDGIARKQAAKQAVDVHPDDPEQWEAEFGRAIQAWIVARCVCDPNDVSKEHPAFRMAEDTIRSTLTAPAITRLFDEIEAHQIASSPIFPEASDGELLELGALLMSEAPVSHIGEAKQARIRRYAHFILAEILEAEPEQDEETELPDA